jgi:MSHA biogenesis protein MshQ
MDNNFPYLPITDGGIITFGVSRSGPVIYTREVYN